MQSAFLRQARSLLAVRREVCVLWRQKAGQEEKKSQPLLYPGPLGLGGSSVSSAALGPIAGRTTGRLVVLSARGRRQGWRRDVGAEGTGVGLGTGPAGGILAGILAPVSLKAGGTWEQRSTLTLWPPASTAGLSAGEAGARCRQWHRPRASLVKFSDSVPLGITAPMSSTSRGDTESPVLVRCSPGSRAEGGLAERRGAGPCGTGAGSESL